MVLKLLDWVLNFTTLNLFVEKRNYQEEHRIQWTTYNNLKCWLYNWEEDLVTIGFAEVQNEKIIANDQLIRIANIDKTCLALDGGSGKCSVAQQLFTFGTIWQRWEKCIQSQVLL